MKRLYKVTTPGGDASYFEKKMDAKGLRNTINKDGEADKGFEPVRVRRGPDHPHGETFGR